MLLSIVFSAYLTLVAGAAAIAASVRLPSRAALATVGFLALWLGTSAWLGATGIVGHYDQQPPGLALLTGPVVATLLLLSLTRPGAVLARNLPLGLLLGFQLFRFGVELTLHRLWGMGLAPRMMTLEGGNIEMLVALTAPIAAWLSSRGTTGRRIAWSWNLVGLLSLANIVARAVLSAPGPFQILHTEVPDMAILLFPFTFIPGFMAPLAMTLHILAFRAFRTGGDADRRAG